MHKFVPAAFISNFTPLLVVLHSTDANAIKSFEYKMWNLLFVAFDDRVKERDLENLEALIEHYAEEVECDKYLYIYIDDALKKMAFEDFLLQKGYKTLFYNYTPERFKKSKERAFETKEESLHALMDALAFEEI